MNDQSPLLSVIRYERRKGIKPLPSVIAINSMPAFNVAGGYKLFKLVFGVCGRAELGNGCLTLQVIVGYDIY